MNTLTVTPVEYEGIGPKDGARRVKIVIADWKGRGKGLLVRARDARRIGKRLLKYARWCERHLEAAEKASGEAEHEGPTRT